ncbi:major facilitator superfamily domain-containing protein [Kickxella alabastrina]|uniref:major facilitator superfamily domain-containing protein n=1 Tax=Kickxella alabastrina TaxID=61397 RepID=UPI00221F5550|nr:major facilitator superfamily domain-containing protein [Kickxella alabastrina]KAI7823099.1 major facilitator superfamily domain-containing protein [Kickxella alabastrina]
MGFQNTNSGSDIRDRDLLRRQQELEELDELTVCGVAFLNDAYDMFAINIVAMILGFVYYHDVEGNEQNTVPKKWDTLIKMLLMIAIITTIASAFSSNMVKGFNVFIVLFIWRYSSVHNRGKMISAVFSCQGFGNVLAPIVGIIVTACFKNSIDRDVEYLDYVWRIIIGIGCVPGVATLYWRLTMEDSKRFQLETAKAAAANADEEMQTEKLLAKRQFNENGDYESHVETPDELQERASPATVSKVRRANHLGSTLPSKFIIRNCLGNIIINILGSVPGYWIAVFTIEKMGRKTMQLMGFGALTVLYIVIGFAYHQILDRSVAGFIVLFTLAQLFQNFGPNVTTFVIPGEVFPTRFRSTAHGIAAASGKLGAIIAQGGFMQLKDRGGKNEFIDRLIQIFALFMLLGFAVTFWIPETKGKTLEEICDESEEYY